ncbi:MAG: hypothetical protein M3Q50_08250 [Chloroflexota bacterium]|nr:hypothetical protein [Chloroflexota bacterium]
MATERLLMRHIREILRLKWTLRRSHRETARSLGISAGAVASVVTRAKAMTLTWDAVGTLSDDALERTLYGPKLALTVARPWLRTFSRALRRDDITVEGDRWNGQAPPGAWFSKEHGAKTTSLCGSSCDAYPCGTHRLHLPHPYASIESCRTEAVVQHCLKGALAR